MYIGHGRLCVCLSLSAFPHYCTDPDVSWGNALLGGFLQSVHGLHCCDSIAPNAKCQRVLVLAICLVYRRACMPLPSQQTDRGTRAILCTAECNRRLITEPFDDWDTGCHVWYTRPVPSLLYQTSDQGPLVYQLHTVRYDTVRTL